MTSEGEQDLKTADSQGTDTTTSSDIDVTDPSTKWEQPGKETVSNLEFTTMLHVFGMVVLTFFSKLI